MTHGLIAVRAGSERVVNKNLRPFAGSSLLERKVRQMLVVPGLDDLVVNSDSPEALDLAKSLGARPVLRRPGMADSSTPNRDFYASVAEQMSCDLICMVTVTAPLLKTETIGRLLELSHAGLAFYDSITTVNKVKEFLWLGGKPLNYEAQKQPRSQDLPEVYALNFAATVVERSRMIRMGSPIGLNPCLYPVDEIEGVDIDTLVDFDFAEFLCLRQP